MTGFIEAAGRADPAERAGRSDARKKEVRAHLGPDCRFPGTCKRTYRGLIDAFHGEPGLPMDERVVVELNSAWTAVMSANGSAPGGLGSAQYQDLSLYAKRQPPILRRLAAEKLFSRISMALPEMPVVQVDPNEVIVCPYSSMALLEEAVATLARPGGVIVCPEGYYKSLAGHVTKFGLRLVTSAATADGFKIDPEALAAKIAEHAVQENLCGVLLTLPGNPVVADYTLDELRAIGRVLIAAEVPVICDMAFDQLVEGHIPIAAITVMTANGMVRLYDRVLTITGNSKAFNAFGPCKVGAACTGNSEWLGEIRDRLRVAFQRETTHLIRATLETVSDEHLARNRKLLREQMDAAHQLAAGINARFKHDLLRPLGSRDGMFMTVEFDATVMNAAGVHDSEELEDLLLIAAGVDSVGLHRTGSMRMGVRLNVVTPRRETGEVGAELLRELFDRIESLFERIDARRLTYPKALLEHAKRRPPG